MCHKDIEFTCKLPIDVIDENGIFYSVESIKEAIERVKGVQLPLTILGVNERVTIGKVLELSLEGNFLVVKAVTNMFGSCELAKIENELTDNSKEAFDICFQSFGFSLPF